MRNDTGSPTGRARSHVGRRRQQRGQPDARWPMAGAGSWSPRGAEGRLPWGAAVVGKEIQRTKQCAEDSGNQAAPC